MTRPGIFPDAGTGVLSPLERFRRIREAATVAEEAAADLAGLGLDDPALDAAVEAFDAACGTVIDLICDPAAAEMMAVIDAFLQGSLRRRDLMVRAPEFLRRIQADLSRPERPPFSHCYRRAMRVAEEHGWATVSVSSARRWLKEQVRQSEVGVVEWGA